ncbi:ABC transporter substrate-binding protein [Mangrovactinospora gilvigrisea]|uniref:ABC transporter substrate-binding protein n=2 Tax=Mangrovactinospora gilvigrisea TaxID=1428644 RepID=A0A1J7CA11_9ACTN|nr:ABC transporter substrate-binding protein [Mangrovactinospora gilvigrisea]
MGLSALGVAGVATLDGCSKATPKGSSGGGKKEFHGAFPYQSPPDGVFNEGGQPFAGLPNSIQGGSPYLDLMMMPCALYHWKAKKWEYYLAESSAFASDGSTFTVKLKSGLTWSNGKPLTSQDLLTTLYVGRILNGPVWSSISKLEAPDKQTLVVHLQNPSAVIDRYVLRANVLDTGTYGTWADQSKALADAGKDMASAENKALNAKFTKFRPKAMVACGPYIIDPKSITDSRMTLVKNPKGYGASTAKFDSVVLYNGETPAVAPLVRGKDIDYATHGFTVAQEKSFVAQGYRILRPPNYSGPALYINYDQLKEFSDPRVRQALAMAINRKTNGEVALGKSGVGVKYMAGFSDIQVPDWMAASDVSKLQTYDYDQAKAAQLLTAAGWKKQGSTWHLPNGKPASYTIKYPAEYADWSASGDDVASQLSSFGIKLQAQGVTFNQFVVQIDKGNFELAIEQWGSSQHPHPYFAFVTDLFTYNYPIAINNGGKGINFNLKVNTKATGPLDLQKVVNASGQGLDVAQQKTNITKAALAFNELLPIIPLFERYGNNPVLDGDRVKKMPPASDPDILNSAYADNFVIMGLLAGTIEPV